jgi:TPR repeat protein
MHRNQMMSNASQFWPPNAPIPQHPYDSAAAESNLADMYFEGKGVPPDQQLFVYWLKIPVELGGAGRTELAAMTGGAQPVMRRGRTLAHAALLLILVRPR